MLIELDFWKVVSVSGIIIVWKSKYGELKIN